MSATLQATDLRFINTVAARRFAGADAGPVDGDAVAAAVAAAGDGTPFVRAAALAGVLLARRLSPRPRCRRACWSCTAR